MSPGLLKKLFAPREEKTPVDIVSDLDEILDFLKEVPPEARQLAPELSKLQELERERHVAKQGLLQINLETQAKVLEKALLQYEFFQNDVDINGLRMKQIALQFLKNAQKAGMKDFVQKKKKERAWKMLW